ncbi:MAG: hypothetical protein LBL08_00415 [Candidatus Nomurabacteria bacterium]|jgi:hypothetical protein|nr:hypothetical protein [Candidatus Nomurabacteria bacterium]
MDKTMSIKQAFLHAASSRVFLTLWVIILLQIIATLVLVFSFGKIGQPGVPYRFDGFSATGIFRDNGSYLLNFALFAVVVPILNIFISLKMYAVKGRSIGIAMLWLTIVLMMIAIVFLVALLNIGNVL